MIEVGDGSLTEVFTGFGRLGASAEQVASEAAGEARVYLASSAVADEHLTDRLFLPLALSGGGAFTAAKLSMHARTNIEVISQFLNGRFATHEKEDAVHVEVMPRA
jgi:RNA 3'-terminal phosphate cyclase (ATP)